MKNYTNMSDSDLDRHIKLLSNELAMIAHAKDTCLVIVAYGTGDRCSFQIIDTKEDPDGQR